MTTPFKSIRVGPYDVTISTLTGSDRDQCNGTFYKGDMTICLQPTYITTQQMATVLLHELFHALYEIMGVKKSDGEERIVDLMSLGMAMVIRDNPDLTGWLKENLS